MQEGIYEQIINEKINQYLSKLDEDKFKYEVESLDVEEAKIYLANYISEITTRALSIIRENKSAKKSLIHQIQLCNILIDTLRTELNDEDFAELRLDEKGEVLKAIYNKVNNIYSFHNKKIDRPHTSIARSSLFTGSENEPNLKEEFINEVKTSNRIDWLVSFIRWTGIRDLMDELQEFTNRGGKFRIITTSYMEATDYKAIKRLASLKNTEIKVSLDKKRTRLHAKSYMFKRHTGFSTAYIGSSNLSNPALTAGLEWNIKVSEKDSFDILSKCAATFETYWNDEEFILLDKANEENWNMFKNSLIRDEVKEEKELYYFDIRPYHYQQEILDILKAERHVHGRWKNLVVAATGVGKTVISAFDFKDYLAVKPDATLLFIAHTEEILEQSRYTFRQILKDHNFGDLYVGNHEPSSNKHLFVSIQTWNSKKLSKLTSKDYYDFIIVDEVHHAPAMTFDRLLNYYQPKILLGLTATPERMDGKDVLAYFDGDIASEIRLTEAINKKLLVPFHYFCITDDIDLSGLTWSRGGYSIKELNKVYNSNDRRSDLIIKAIDRYITDIEEVKGLGFCVSVEHAIYMAAYFNKRNIPSIALHGNSEIKERNDARKLLRDGKIRFIFVVDLYNEGVDIPEVNTILFLRPTESLTIFLQQLGRGLRLADDKECLTVLDFVGQAHQNYSFEEKFRALIGKTNRSVQDYVENGFFDMPKGSIIHMEKVAREYILKNVVAKQINKNRLVDMIKQFELNTEKALTLTNFLKHHQLSLADLYGRSGTKRSFSRLLYEAGKLEEYDASFEKEFNSLVHRLFHLDSVSLIDQFIDIAKGNFNVTKKVLAMFYYSFFNQPPGKLAFKNMEEAIRKLFSNVQWKKETVAILNNRREDIHFIEKDNPFTYENPLKVHAHYNTNQIMAAFGYFNEEAMPQFREGVKYFEELQTDVFFITLNKSDKDFSITTQYDDYAINDTLFHWQSQNKTGENTTVGKRYINHKAKGSQVALFVREYKVKDGYTAPFTFLGTATYVSHEGEKPMSIIWKLDEALPSYLKPKAKKASV